MTDVQAIQCCKQCAKAGRTGSDERIHWHRQEAARYGRISSRLAIASMVLAVVSMIAAMIAAVAAVAIR